MRPTFDRIVKTADMDAQRTKRGNAHVWHVVLCLFVAALCLYNPFFTVYGDSGSLHVHHPLSYRGTIASSELRRCVFEPSAPLISDIVVLGAWAQTQDRFLEAHSFFSVRPSNDAALAIQQVVLDSLWFRPPPKS
jgi:hypothetical protein